jgi:hypothetical protein
MPSHSRNAIDSLGRAKQHAQSGDFGRAINEWTDACDSAAKAKTVEPRGPGTEFTQALDEALRLLDTYGRDMAKAAIESQDADAIEREVLAHRERLEKIREERTE